MEVRPLKATVRYRPNRTPGVDGCATGRRASRSAFEPDVLDARRAHALGLQVGHPLADMSRHDGGDDLIFALPHRDLPGRQGRALPDPAALVFTEPNDAGRQYRHGTMSGYNAGRCRYPRDHADWVQFPS